jgi:hypothetical protein
MPRKFTAPVITINFRLPPKLHRQLETIAKRGGTSINAEVVQRLERSIELDKWPKVEELALALVMQAVPGMPHGEKLANLVLEDIGRLLGENRPVPRLLALFNKQLADKGQPPVFVIKPPKNEGEDNQ